MNGVPVDRVPYVATGNNLAFNTGVNLTVSGNQSMGGIGQFTPAPTSPSPAPARPCAFSAAASPWATPMARSA